MTFFYVIIIIVVFVLATMVYVSFVFSRRTASFSFVVMALRNILLLFTTIFFLPFFEYFITITACVSDTRGILVHSYFTDVECWKGPHILHTIFSIIGCIIFAAISLSGSLLFFEYKTNSNNPTSRYYTSYPIFINTL